jgi:hypothetical protein
VKQRLQVWTEVCSLWEQCYEAEGLDPTAPVLVFRQGNPHQAKYAEAVARYIGDDLL